jgi:hypothetical protein
MTLLRIGALLSLFSASCIQLTAQTFADFKELKQIKVVVEELDSDASHAGITREALEA